MRRLRAFSIALLVAVEALSVQAGSSWSIGTYVLIGTKPGDEGTLVIPSVDKMTATFSLTSVSCRRDCETDTPYAIVRDIDRGTVEISGESGWYRSAGPEGETQASKRGMCVLKFSLERNVITVNQLSSCSWIGMDVDVSGTYKPMPAHGAK